METSVWNFMFADDAPEKKAATKKLFTKVSGGDFEIFISEHVILEIDRTKSQNKKKQLYALIAKYKPVILETTPEIIEISNKYLENGVLSEKHIDDIRHLSYASANDIHVLVSWNLKHLVRHSTKMMANAVNKMNGYGEIDICRPEELI